MDGTVLMELTLTADNSGFETGRITGGVMHPTGPITAEVPNFFWFLPPLATIHIDNAEFSVLSNGSFAVDAAGDFVTAVTLIPVAGTVTITDFFGTQTIIEVADWPATDPSAADPISGNVRPAGTDGSPPRLTAPIVFSAYDEGDGSNWIEFDIDGDLVAMGSSWPTPAPTPAPILAPCADDDAQMIELVSGVGFMISGCAVVTSYCEHPVYGSTVQAVCPPTCGLCTPCADDDAQIIQLASGVGLTISGCAVVTSYCEHPVYGSTVQETCPATCGHCTAPVRRLASWKDPDADELDWIEELAAPQADERDWIDELTVVAPPAPVPSAEVRQKTGEISNSDINLAYL